MHRYVLRSESALLHGGGDDPSSNLTLAGALNVVVFGGADPRLDE